MASTSFFIAVLTDSYEKEMIARGKALSFSLSKAAQEGLMREDLDLLKKASDLIKAPDVTLVQVYSDLWEAIDSVPFAHLKYPPNAGAQTHFQEASDPVFFMTDGGYDFYRSVFFEPFHNSPSMTIGYVRVILSSTGLKHEIRELVVINVSIATVITLIAVILVNLLISRIVVNPVMRLYMAMRNFKNGILPGGPVISNWTADEMHELGVEFYEMCKRIKDKEDRLIESERRIRELFERVEHGIFRLDENGFVLESNIRFRKKFGEVGNMCDIFLEKKSVDECVRRALDEKILHWETETIGKKGETLTVSLTLYPELDERGKLLGFDGYIIDITEKKRMEERLIRAQKMEAVGTLAGGMAHDFNNLLTAILGYSEIILSTTKEGDPFHKPAQIIYEAARRGADFGQKILAITRKEKVETKPVSLNQIIRNSMELLIRSIPKDIEIETHLQEELPLTKGDPSQLQQVVINLAVNARDAMPDGGKLTIETSIVGDWPGGLAGLSDRENAFVRLAISDTGIGIDSMTQQQIFDPFFTTKEKGKGTGLGLYIVHSIVTNHGGYINVQSEPMRGTQFNIYLPVTHDTDIPDASGGEAIRGSGTILVIDDERDVRELCRDMLEPLGYTLELAESGTQGVDIFREKSRDISVVILDMIMPKMSGREVFQALKTIDTEVKVILCSGYSQDGFGGIDELLRTGAAGFVQKPFSRQTLALSIKKILTRQT